MKKTNFKKVSVTMIVIAAIIAGAFYPAAKYSSVYADGAYVLDGRSDAGFLHNKTMLSGNTDSAPVITFMHHGISGGYGALEEVAKYLSVYNDADIYYARVAGTPAKGTEDGPDEKILYGFKHSTEKDEETKTIPKETAPV
ncbi:MAG: hypothetical protein LBP79_07585 [Clostridiales bacterium]|jgi:hypothetical protein|nr:hypothetical protein [Clostridiales bacterium]